MHNQRLKYLYLRNSSMGHMGAEAISKLIMGNKSLTELDIYKCMLPEDGGLIISQALKQNFCIQKLSIGENQITKKDIEVI